MCANKKLLRRRLSDPAYRKEHAEISKQIEDINMDLWSVGYHCEGEYQLVKMHYPRRNSLPSMTFTERAIWDVARLVESQPASPHLTEAVILLTKAREKVADYVDEQLEERRKKYE